MNLFKSPTCGNKHDPGLNCAEPSPGFNLCTFMHKLYRQGQLMLTHTMHIMANPSTYSFVSTPHVGHVQLQQYGFRARLIFPSYFHLFLLQASLDQSKTSTKQKTKKPSQTRHTIRGNNYSLCREMSAQMKQVK